MEGITGPAGETTRTPPFAPLNCRAQERILEESSSRVLAIGLYRIDGTHASASTKPGLRIDLAAAGNQATDRPEDLEACPTLHPSCRGGSDAPISCAAPVFSGITCNWHRMLQWWE